MPSNTPIGAQVYAQLLHQFSRYATADYAHPAPPGIEGLAVALADPHPGSRIYAAVADHAMMLAAAGSAQRRWLTHPDDTVRRDQQALRTGRSLDPDTGRARTDIRLAGTAHTHQSTQLGILHMELTGTYGWIHDQPVRGQAAAARPFDIVLTAPPRTTAADPTTRARFAEVQDWPFGTPTAHNANYAWLQYSWHRLPPGGRAIVVTAPDAGHTRRYQDIAIRANMLDAGVVEAVVTVPDPLSGPENTAAHSALWVLNKPAEHAHTAREEVLFIDACGLATDTGRPPGFDTLSARILDAVEALRTGHGPDTEPGFCAAVPRAGIIAADYSALASHYVGTADPTSRRTRTGARPTRAPIPEPSVASPPHPKPGTGTRPGSRYSPGPAIRRPKP